MDEKGLVPFVDKILELSDPVIKEFYELLYSDKKFDLIKKPRPNPLTVFSLDSLISFCEFNENKKEKVLIVVEGYDQVSIYDELDDHQERNKYLISKIQIPGMFDRYYPTEEFIILLQSYFATTELRDLILTIAGNCKNSNIRAEKDDGITQEIEIKTGIITKEWAKIPNPVGLYPYRTFPEIEPLESLFVLRAKSDTNGTIYFALFQAQGKLWEYKITEKIKNYLYTNLAGWHVI